MLHRLALVAALSLALPAMAQGAARYHPVEYVAASGARVVDAGTGCPTGTPGYNPAPPYNGTAPWGLGLDLRGWSFTLCAETGQTLSGAGTLRTCVFRNQPQGPGVWASSPLTWDLASRTDVVGKQCATFRDYWPLVGYGRVYVYPAGAVTVSGGTKVTVHMHGESR